MSCLTTQKISHDFLVVARLKLYHGDVGDKIKDISIRFTTLKMKEYADEHIYAT